VCGQNILISSHPVPWFFTIESWWLEKDLFTYGGQNKLSEVGFLYFSLMRSLAVVQECYSIISIFFKRIYDVV
jgi:hypothetical protein